MHTVMDPCCKLCQASLLLPSQQLVPFPPVVQLEAKKKVLSDVSQVDDMYDMLAAYEQKVRVCACSCVCVRWFAWLLYVQSEERSLSAL